MLDRPSERRREAKYINYLAKIAETVEPVAKARIAACLVYQNEIISVGINQLKTHPFQARFGKNKDSIYLHAETSCIKQALKVLTLEDISRCDLYVCRIKYEDKLKERMLFGMAKPCLGCSRAIASFDIRNVFYTLDGDGYGFL